LERLGAETRIADSPGVASAMEIRRQAARRDAVERCHVLVEELAEERQAGAWKMVGEILARITSLQTEHGFHVTAPEAAVCADMKLYFEDQRAAAEATARFRETLGNLNRLADEIDTRLLTHSTLKLGETESMYLEFNRRWKELEHFGRPVPDDVIQRVVAAAAGLRGELERLQKQRQTTLITIAAAALAIFGVAAWFAIGAYRAQDYARQLAALRESGQVEAAEKMIRHLRTDQPGLAGRPLLGARLDDVDKWTRDERARQTEAESLLESLEKLAGADFRDADPMPTGTQLTTAGELVATLPAGLQATSSNRLTVIRNSFDAHLASILEKLLTQGDE